MTRSFDEEEKASMFQEGKVKQFIGKSIYHSSTLLLLFASLKAWYALGFESKAYQAFYF